MTRGAARPRSGITLIEILISILIMGVGLISLATLFPLGLLRLQQASWYHRSALQFETTSGDIDARQLFDKQSFTRTWSWYTSTVNRATVNLPRDPFTQDGSLLNDVVANAYISSNPFSSFSIGSDSGLPVAYDPLWRSLTGVLPNSLLTYDQTLQSSLPTSSYQVGEARFGSGLFGGTAPYIRPDPLDSQRPSAFGLQRITNFVPWSNVSPTTGYTSQVPQWPFTSTNLGLSLSAQPADVSGNVFSSIDDIVFNPIGGGANAPSSILPEMFGASSTFVGSPQIDYKYTWFFTGRQTDAGGNGRQFTGNIVVCDGRPFGFDPLPGNGSLAPAGETAVEAIFGVGGANTVVPVAAGASVGFSNNGRSVLLRWNAALADPQVKVGGWICDVTYERDFATYASRAKGGTTLPLSSYARCGWYQVAKRTDPQADATIAGYRSMTVTLTSPVQNRTLLNVSDGSPVSVNVALIMPSVIYAFPIAFEVH